MNRHGVVIVVVLMVIVAMAVGLVAMISDVRGQSDTVFAEIERSSQRLAARSAVLALAEEIWADRDRVLSGKLPGVALTEQILLSEEGSSWERTLMALSDGRTIEPMSARLDCNNSSREQLERLLSDHVGAAEAIVAGRPFRSPGQIAGVLRRADISEDELPGVLSLLTVSSWDAPVRSGAGGQGRGEARGRPGGGGDAPGSLSSHGVAMFEQLAAGDFAPSTRGELVRRLAADAVPMEDWDVLLDTFDIGSEAGRFGLIDLNHASEDALATLPGIDATVAKRLVDLRETLTPDQRLGVVWPVSEGIVDVETFAGMVDRLTMRSLQYSFRVRVSSEHGEDEDFETVENGLDRSASQVVVEYEVVVDLSGTRARVVYVREVTDERWKSRPEKPESTKEAEGEESDILILGGDAGSADGAEPDRGEVKEPAASESGPARGWGRWLVGQGSSEDSDGV